MFINLQPVFGTNYRSGQIYLTYDIGNAISIGISWFEYKSGGTPDIEKVSHCGVVISERFGVSAQPRGVDLENLIDIFNDPHRRIVFIEPVLLDTLGALALTQGMYSRIGTKYDWRLIAGFGIVNSWLGRKLPERVQKEILRWFDCKGRVVCSEVICQELYKGGYCTDSNTRKTPEEMATCKCIKKWKRD